MFAKVRLSLDRLLTWIIFSVKKFLLLIAVALFGGAALASAGSYEDHLYEDRLRQWHEDSVRQNAEEDARLERLENRNDENEKSFGRSRKARHEGDQPNRADHKR